MKQTAVDWLYSKWSEQATLYLEDLEQAKSMEKEQIMKARQDIFHTGNLTNEQYYKETFKSE